MSSFVYFLRAGEKGPVKIGFTTVLLERLKALHVGNAVAVIRVIEGNRATERWLHQHFSEIRRNGEWFDYHPEMMTVVPPDELPDEARPRPQHTPAAAEEAKEIIREAMKPIEVGDKLDALIRKAASRLGLSYARTRSMWYGIARLITADEIDRLRRVREALQLEQSLVGECQEIGR